SDPNQVVKVAQRVEVTVLEVDLDRKRISLSMKQGATGEKKEAASKAPAAKGPQGPRRPDKPRQDKQKQDNRKPEPAPFNNPFARAFEKGKAGKDGK
ncbi:MAG TPA: S1 RNA-binding domain-containing protein, partial [Syntrophales bacterium]|nr:S1 RNA-binding domain-containing protein [Syntrophales bacterium]